MTWWAWILIVVSSPIIAVAGIVTLVAVWHILAPLSAFWIWVVKGIIGKKVTWGEVYDDICIF